jgi:pullulanase/glycogen debranching enzyme
VTAAPGSSAPLGETVGRAHPLVEKIPYLCDLGGTAVELLPVFQFDATRQRVTFLVAPGEGEA